MNVEVRSTTHRQLFCRTTSDATNRLLDKTTQSFDHGAVDELCVNCAGYAPPEEWFLKEPEANAEHVQRPQAILLESKRKAAATSPDVGV